jgi:hypothetical protein
MQRPTIPPSFSPRSRLVSSHNKSHSGYATNTALARMARLKILLLFAAMDKLLSRFYSMAL